MPSFSRDKICSRNQKMKKSPEHATDISQLNINVENSMDQSVPAHDVYETPQNSEISETPEDAEMSSPNESDEPYWAEDDCFFEKHECRDFLKPNDVVTFREEEYVVDRLLGAGTYGCVWKCSCKTRDFQMALKVISLESETVYEEEVEFLELLNQRDKDDSIVRLLGTLEGYEFFGICMELMEDSVLNALKNYTDPNEKLKAIRLILRQIFRGLKVFHSLKLVHTDLSIVNLMVNYVDGVPHAKIIDIGNAHFDHTIRKGDELTTFEYRAPEALVGGRCTEKIDMWSAGCVAAEMYFGKPYFYGTTDLNLLHRIHAESRINTNSRWVKSSTRRAEFFQKEGKKFVVKDYMKGKYRKFRKRIKPDPDNHLLESFVKLVEQLLISNPEERLSAAKALKSDFIKDDPVLSV